MTEEDEKDAEEHTVDFVSFSYYTTRCIAADVVEGGDANLLHTMKSHLTLKLLTGAGDWILLDSDDNK